MIDSAAMPIDRVGSDASVKRVPISSMKQLKEVIESDARHQRDVVINAERERREREERQREAYVRAAQEMEVEKLRFPFGVLIALGTLTDVRAELARLAAINLLGDALPPKL